jgi:hypothetical protein
MKEVRYNLSTKFYFKEDSLYIFSLGKKITLKFDRNMYDFFIFLEEHVVINDIYKVATQFWLHPKLLELFFFLEIIIPRSNHWGVEALWFDSLAKNPSVSAFSSELSQDELLALYKTIPSNFVNSFTDHLQSFKKYSFNMLKCEGSLQRHFSDRITKASLPWVSLERMLSIIYNIFSLHISPHNFYGSWWGFYSIFPVIFVNDDKLLVYNKYDDCFYFKQIDGIYNLYINNCLIANTSIDFSSYTYHIVLVSSFVPILKKYWNRGYKYIQMETWSIWTLCRLFFASYNVSHVEIQGYFDDPVYSLLSHHANIIKDKILVCHTISCN